MGKRQVRIEDEEEELTLEGEATEIFAALGYNVLGPNPSYDTGVEIAQVISTGNGDEIWVDFLRGKNVNKVICNAALTHSNRRPVETEEFHTQFWVITPNEGLSRTNWRKMQTAMSLRFVDRCIKISELRMWKDLALTPGSEEGATVTA